MPTLKMDVKPSDDCSDIGGASANGAVTKYRFVELDATAPSDGLTIATEGAGNVGVCINDAADGEQAGVRFYGVYWLSIYPLHNSTEIKAGDHLTPSAGGRGIKADPALIEEATPYNAIALEDGGTPGAGVVGKCILVRIEYGWLYAEEVS
jgi:hypothetical protein